MNKKQKRCHCEGALDKLVMRGPAPIAKCAECLSSATQPGAPTLMQKIFPWREDQFIRCQPDRHDHQHHPDDLIHRVEFSPVVQELSEPETPQDRHTYFTRHERTPPEPPSLLHAPDHTPH